MSSNVVVLDKPIVEPVAPKVFSKVIISVVNIELGVSASIQATLVSDSGSETKILSLLMSGSDYSAWGGDDQYVIDWVLSQLKQ